MISRVLNLIRHSNTFATGTTVSVPAQSAFEAGLVCPTPDPATFSSAPAQNGAGSVTMTASAATGIGTIQYKFFCEFRPQYDSDWQTSRTYAPTGLTSGLSLKFSCRSRNQNHAETRPSAWSSAVVVL